MGTFIQYAEDTSKITMEGLRSCCEENKELVEKNSVTTYNCKKCGLSWVDEELVIHNLEIMLGIKK